MKRREAISKIMTANPITVNHNNSMKEVDELFSSNNFHHIPVVSGDNLIGIISKVDVERIKYVSDYTQKNVNAAVFGILTIEQVMTRNVKSVQQNNTIKDAVEIFSTGSVHALPVMDGKKVVGIVTTTDVMNFLMDQF